MNSKNWVQRGESGGIRASFAYNPIFVEKVKIIKGHKWHPESKHWSFPNTNGTLEKILKVFGGEKIHIDSTLQKNLSTSVIVMPKSWRKQSHDFEDLRRELVSRKYSEKTVKAYIHYNEALLKFAKKNPLEINNEDTKNYLFYLAENKNFSASTLNIVINAMKFYYGDVLKRGFVYEIMRPKKDKKLPVVLSKEEVSKILSSITNLKHKVTLMLTYSAGLRVSEVVKLKL